MEETSVKGPWLLRTATNRIAGPYTREEVRELIREGALELQDELCPANGNWILLSEREEILREFGIEITSELTEDVTMTGTHTETETETQTQAATETHVETQAPAVRGAPAEVTDGEGEARAQAREPAWLPVLVWVLLFGASALVLAWILWRRRL